MKLSFRLSKEIFPVLHFAMLLSMALATSCSRQTESPVWQFMPHMASTPNLKAMKGYHGSDNNPNAIKGSYMLMPPEGTIARGYKPYRFESPEDAARALENPLKRSKENLARGQKIFNTYCITCHGPRGLGDGPIVNPYPIPKSLQSEQMLAWKDGHLFHVITKGQGVMPSYAQQVQAEDRWAVIHYVRALQRAEHPTEEDLRDLKKISQKQ